MKISTIYDYSNSEVSPQWETSQTIPNDALSVRDILQRYTNNQPCNLAVHPDVGVDADSVGWDSLASVDLSNMDLAEIDEFTAYLRQRKSALQDELNQQRISQRKSYRDKRNFDDNLDVDDGGYTPPSSSPDDDLEVDDDRYPNGK